MIGTVASIMSSTIINVAVPDMSRYFMLGQERLQWVASGFMVAMTVSMLTTPWLLSRFGYRRTYACAIALLLAGGIGGGLSSNFDLVLVARVAEGLASGVLQPIPAIIILRVFHPSEQGRAGGLFGMGAILAPAMGPSVGGLLIEWFSWRATFFMVVPFCLVALYMAQRFIPNADLGSEPEGKVQGPLDWFGLALATISTLCLLNGLVTLGSGPTLNSVFLFAAASLTLWAFVYWQRRLNLVPFEAREKTPLMNLAVFHQQRFSLGCLVAFIYGTALFGSTYLLPMYLQLGIGMSARHIGTLMMPAGLVLAFTIPLAGRLADHQPPSILVCIGLLLLTLGFALMVTVRLETPIWVISAWVIVGRIGLGFILPSLNLAVMRGMQKDLIPQGASTIGFIRMVGGAVGVGLCSLVLEWRLAAHGQSFAHPSAGPERLAAFNESFLMLATLCLLAVVAAWQMQERKNNASIAK